MDIILNGCFGPCLSYPHLAKALCFAWDEQDWSAVDTLRTATMLMGSLTHTPLGQVDIELSAYEGCDSLMTGELTELDGEAL